MIQCIINCMNTTTSGTVLYMYDRLCMNTRLVYTVVAQYGCCMVV